MLNKLTNKGESTMRVNKKYNNKYIIKLNDKVVSRRNTRHLYNYCFLRIVKSEKLSKGFGIYHEVDKYYMPYWDKNHFNQTGNYTKKELGSKYYNLLSDITSYTNDRSTFEFELESVLRTYVPAKVLKGWIARAEEVLEQHQQNEERV